MRWIPITLCVVAVGVGASAAGGTAQKASLRITDRDPLTLRGQGFQPRERIRVIVSAPVAENKVTRAGAAGTFKVTFLDVTTDRCSAVRAVARGGESGRAVLKFLPAPMCMPMRTP